MKSLDEKTKVTIMRGQSEPDSINARLVGEISLREPIPTADQVRQAMELPVKSKLWMLPLGIALLLVAAATLPSLFVESWFFSIYDLLTQARRLGGPFMENLAIILFVLPPCLAVFFLLLPFRGQKPETLFSDLWPTCYFYKRDYKSKWSWTAIGASKDYSNHLTYNLAFVLEPSLLLTRDEVKKKLTQKLSYRRPLLPNVEVEGLLETLNQAIGTGLSSVSVAAPTSQSADYAARWDGTAKATEAENGTYLVEGNLLVLRKKGETGTLLRLKISFFAVKNKRRILPVHPVQRLEIVEDEALPPEGPTV